MKTTSSNSRGRATRAVFAASIASLALVVAACSPAPTDGAVKGANGSEKTPTTIEGGTIKNPSVVAPPTTAPQGTDKPGTEKPGTDNGMPGTPTQPSMPTTPAQPSPGGNPGLAVDVSRIPAARPGVGSPRIGAAQYSKRAGDGSAQFRVNCLFSHMGFNDPVVFPGRANASHLHIFFGNTSVDSTTTPESVRSSGNSTCAGGTANRSSYWAPAVIDTATGAPVISDANQTDRDHFLQVYYKTGYDGVLPATVRNFPVGLRMIAGTASSTSPQQRIVSYSCTEGSAAQVPQQASFPQCAPGQLFIMSVLFPQCWDGVNLDSPDHKSHMAYGAGWPDKGCPSSHPVPLAQITQNFRYRVPAGGMANWRLSSDMYSGPAGYSGHADWMNGWDPAVFQRVIDNCYRGGFDCQMNLLGDGQALL